MDKIKPTEIKLKNDKIVLIRPANLNDAEELLNCLKKYIAQSEFIPKLEDEIQLTVEQERDWINSFLKSPNSLLLIAKHQNQIIGNIDLTGNPRNVMQHTAVIGMGMLAEWRNIGLGTALMKMAIDWARQNPILELLWLQVYNKNETALNLYLKMGFEVNGILKNYFRQNGTYFDNVTMSLSLIN